MATLTCWVLLLRCPGSSACSTWIRMNSWEAESTALPAKGPATCNFSKALSRKSVTFMAERRAPSREKCRHFADSKSFAGWKYPPCPCAECHACPLHWRFYKVLFDIWHAYFFLTEERNSSKCLQHIGPRRWWRVRARDRCTEAYVAATSSSPAHIAVPLLSQPNFLSIHCQIKITIAKNVL